MKHKNNKGLYTEAFRKDLYRAYKQTLNEHMQEDGYIIFDRVVEDTINKSAKRFWVSEQQAYSAIRHLLDGKMSDKTLPSKMEMFLEIYSRVIVMRRKFPNLELREVVNSVCEQQAPKFYITFKSARTILCNIIKCKKEQKIQRALQ